MEVARSLVVIGDVMFNIKVQKEDMGNQQFPECSSPQYIFLVKDLLTLHF